MVFILKRMATLEGEKNEDTGFSRKSANFLWLMSNSYKLEDGLIELSKEEWVFFNSDIMKQFLLPYIMDS